MKLKEWINWKENWTVFVVLFLYIPAFWWWGIWSHGSVLRWWRAFEGKVATPTFFEWEEFIALHSHNNEWPGRIGFYGIILLILIFLLLYAVRIIRIPVRQAAGPKGLMVLLAFTLIILFFSICLCRSKEKEARWGCQSALNLYQKAFISYFNKHESYPSALQTSDFPDEASQAKLEMFITRYCHHLYPGADKKPDDQCFIVIEDAPRAHAGDLRHRLWSDGTIDSYYPWKSNGGAK